ncbi:MAG: hypothetical protein ACLR4Z_17985 [Butyricicoccaceae bacterium]
MRELPCTRSRHQTRSTTARSAACSSVSGEAQTDNEWLASWFSGRAGFTVETVTAEEAAEPTEDKPRGKRRNDKGNADAVGAKSAAEPAAGNA